MSITVGSPVDPNCYLVALWVTESNPSGTLVGFLDSIFFANPAALETHILTINSLTSQAIPWGATYDGSSCYENNFEGFIIPQISFNLAISHVSPPLTSPG
jgi:hypothetical protein